MTTLAATEIGSIVDGKPPTQQAREIARERREAERQRRAEEKAEAAEARARQKSIDTAIRTGGKVVTSRLGQDIIRGVFGTLFGGGRKR